MPKEKLIKSRKIYTGSLLGLRQDFVRLPNHKTARREICEHPGAVAVIPVLKDKIVLIKQYRRPADEILLEIPAGLVKKGEALKTAAKRELKEETGYLARKLKKIFSGFTSPGYSTEIIHFFLAQDLELSFQETEEDEFIEVEILPFAKSLDLIKKGRIRDNKTIIAVLALQAYAKLY